MKLSIVIICWNDLKVLPECLKSLTEQTRLRDYEIIISDNGSADGCVDFVRTNYPAARIVENKANLGYARGNNAGIKLATGDYVLILNPDTIIHEGAIDKWIEYADKHPEAGAFGCKVLNPDGSWQDPCRPFPTNWHYLQVALRLKQNTYRLWKGQYEREIDWQSGCAILVRADLLNQLKGFDERFFYTYEEVDLCYRVWQAGKTILYTPDVVITHLGGQSTGRFPVRFEIEKFRNRYRYFYKHFGLASAKRSRLVALLHLRMRQLGYGLAGLLVKDKTDAMNNRMKMLRMVTQWNKQLDVARFIETGEEPKLGSESEPLAPAPKMMASQC